MNIKDEDLLSLHYQIEKAETKQKKLEDLLVLESNSLKESKKAIWVLGVFSLALLLLVIFLTIRPNYSLKTSKSNAIAYNDSSLRISSLKKEIVSLKQERNSIKEIKDLYFYRSLINKDTVYSVQFKAFSNKKIPSISNKYTNTLIYNDTSYFKMSLGIFETLAEAQNFRKTLINSGFDKRIFVISYKDGKRLKIENYQ
ncbi:hypothetical protein [Aquimarina sp. I32.4]|uniref:hypothetical protein n=1 Tax=Aquimarina sp. I32.4 TaxID=2053903 RepID=UPI000CDEF45A|nr:hypothetical protein [Aquimarina sp. I32.4]